MTKEIEEWKKFNDTLEVSCLGRVRTIARFRFGRGYKNTITKRWLPSIIRKQIVVNKYLCIVYRVDGTSKMSRVNRMVALLFCQNPHNKPFVNHLDCDKFNNKASNLEWCTALENNKHARDNGRTNPPKGINHWKNKLDEIQVKTIRRCLKDGMTQQKLADYFKVHRTCISAIHLKYHWGHLS